MSFLKKRNKSIYTKTIPEAVFFPLIDLNASIIFQYEYYVVW